MTWAERLEREFNFDITICSRCGGGENIIACIEDSLCIPRHHVDWVAGMRGIHGQWTQARKEPAFNPKDAIEVLGFATRTVEASIKK